MQQELEFLLERVSKDKIEFLARKSCSPIRHVDRSASCSREALLEGGGISQFCFRGRSRLRGSLTSDGAILWKLSTSGSEVISTQL